MVAVEGIVAVATEVERSHVTAGRVGARAFTGVVQLVIYPELEGVVPDHPGQVIGDPHTFIGGGNGRPRIEIDIRRTWKPAERHPRNEVERVRAREELPQPLEPVPFAAHIRQLKLVVQRAQLPGLAVANVELVDDVCREDPVVAPRVGVGDVLVMVRLEKEVGV